MDTEILLQEFKDSPAGKALIAQHESERLTKRQAAVEAIRVVQQEYDALTKQLDPKIEAAQRAIGEFRRKFDGALEEANRLAGERRIGAIDRDRLIKIQEDQLLETVHPGVTAAINKCWEKLSELRRKSVAGESRGKANLWGIVSRAVWSNSNAMNANLEVIRRLIERLENMRLEANEDEVAQVARLMNEIPKGELATEYSEWDHDPEQVRLSVRRAVSHRG